MFQATSLFQWDSSRGRFLAALQREREEARVAAVAQLHHEEKVLTVSTKYSGMGSLLHTVAWGLHSIQWGFRHGVSGMGSQACGLRHGVSGMWSQAWGLRHGVSGMGSQAWGLRHGASTPYVLTTNLRNQYTWV